MRKTIGQIISMVAAALTFILIVNIYKEALIKQNEITLGECFWLQVSLYLLIGLVGFLLSLDYNQNWFKEILTSFKQSTIIFLLEIVLLIPFALILLALTYGFDPWWFFIIVLLLSFFFYVPIKKIKKEIEKQQK